MGGYFSTRWNAEHTRRDTAGLLRLDVRHMHRTGVFEPGARAVWQWSNERGEPAGEIRTVMDRDRPCLTLEYATRAPGEPDWTPRRESVCLDTTPCHYGGHRWWFTCPGCQRRRAVLFSVGGVFRCRGCHDLAYVSTRLDTMSRTDRTIHALQRRLGAPAGCNAWHIPPKPARMHWSTYERLASQLSDAIERRNDLFTDRAVKLLARTDRLLASRGIDNP